MSLKDAGLMWVWSILGILSVCWIVSTIRDTAFQNGYWKGRAHGFEMHRRMINIKKESDKVFDYEQD